MDKKDNIPLWVFLAFSSIETRKGALILIWCSAVFTLYCIPWRLFITDNQWVEMILLIDDWSWLAMMLPITVWYLLSLKWTDRNEVWKM